MQSPTGRSGSLAIFENEDLDVMEIQSQLNEYKENIFTTLKQDHESASDGAGLPHFDQLQQMINHLTFLSDALVNKAHNQDEELSELKRTQTEMNEKMMNFQQNNIGLEDELEQERSRMKQMQAEMNDVENRLREKDQQIQEANNTIEEFRGVNGVLQQQLENVKQSSQERQLEETQRGSQQLDKKDDQIKELLQQIEDLQYVESDNNKHIEYLKEQNKNLEIKVDKIYRDVQQNEIIQEKKRYELYIKVKEQNNILKQTKRDLQEKETQLDLLKQEHALALSKKMILETTGEGSFTNMAANSSILSNSPSPIKRDRNSLLLGLGVVQEEEDENQQGKNDVFKIQAQETDMVPNELDNFENHNGNPNLSVDYMPKASVTSNDNIQYGFPQDQSIVVEDQMLQDYRSHGSSDEEEKSPKRIGMNPVEVEEMDDFPTNEGQEQVPEKKSNSIVNDKPQIVTDLEFESNETKPESPAQTAIVKIEDPMNELNSMNFLVRDPEEEFFMLAVLALKMIHNEEYDKSNYACEISAGKLFKQVKEENMPFHRWYKWLEKKFEELRLAFLKEAESRLQELERWQVVDTDHLDLSEHKTKKKQGFFGRMRTKFSGKDKQAKEMKIQRSNTVQIDDVNGGLEQIDALSKIRKESMANKGEF